MFHLKSVLSRAQIHLALWSLKDLPSVALTQLLPLAKISQWLLHALWMPPWAPAFLLTYSYPPPALLNISQLPRAPCFP